MKNLLPLARAAALALLLPLAARAQTPGVGIGTTIPNSSAALDVSSTSKGLLPPRMSQTQRDAIASPAVGLTVVNTTTGKLNMWDGSVWTELLASATQATGTAATFSFTGAPQTYTVPAGVTRLRVTAVGAGGGNALLTTGNNAGGGGGQVVATLAVTPGEVLTAYVGGRGANNSTTSSGGAAGGYNGGGTAPARLGGSGGGATDLRRGSAALADRLVVAGGGGGGSWGSGSASATFQGGAGGNPGGTSSGANSGGGGTATAGGAAGGGTLPGQAGTLGQGGNGGGTSTNTGAGGGGGYYGGGGGGAVAGASVNRPLGAGGGGSSYALPAANGVAYTTGGNAGNGTLTLEPVPTLLSPALDGSNFVNVPGDNLGNHTATQALNLGTNALVGNGGSTGLTISSSGTTTTSGSAYVAGSVGIGTTSPAASAILDLTSSTKGALLPRLDGVQRNAIASPATGLTIYNTDTDRLNVWDGTAWTELLTATTRLPAPVATTFGFTGAAQTYIVPAGVTRLRVSATGAAGGNNGGQPGGGGGRTTATLLVTPGETLTVQVGGLGGAAENSGGPGAAGGYNGGGAAPARYSGGGGGATDLRRGSAALADRLVVAGGGGGRGFVFNSGGTGGNPGGAGLASGAANGGGGGTATAGGAGGTGVYPGQAGTLGQGGNGGATGIGFSNNAGGGGGGGYYGGGGGAVGNGGGETAGGGGGSSWASSAALSASFLTGVNTTADGSLTLEPVGGVPAPALDATNFVNLPADNDAQQLSKAGSTISLTNGGSVTDADNQALSISGSTISLVNGGSVTVPSSADNLGNHTATTNVGLNNNWLSNAAGNANGLRVDNSGNVGVGVANPVTQLANSAGNVIATDGNGVSSQALNWVSTTTGYAAGVANTGTAGNSNGLAVKVGGTDGVALDISRGAIAAPGSPLLRVLGGGNVGVGVNVPTQTLDVNGGILARGFGAISNQGAYLQWNRTGGAGETWLLNQQGGGGGGIRFGGVTTANVATEWARFDGSGNFGVGTNPSQKLEVAGTIYSNTGGFRFPDNTVQTTAAVTATGASFIQNTTTAQAGANFNVAGNGTVGGNQSVGGTSTVTGNQTVGGTSAVGGNETVAGTSTITGNAYVNGGLGVVLNQQDRPLITRGWDAFTSGNYNGAGRWGVFMEASTLTFGVPAATGKNFQWATYDATSAINTRLMTLTQAGQLGLGTGTTGPVTTLDVRTADNSATITVGKTDGTAGALLFGNANHGLKRGFGGAGNDLGLFTTAGNLFLSAAGNASTGQFVLLSNGNVGIGANPPTQKLDVAGGILARGSDLVSTQGAHLQWNRSTNQGETWLLNQNGGGPGGIRFGQTNAVSTGSNTVAEWARFDGSGKFGIGTTDPIAPLHVKGAAGTTTQGGGGYTYYFPGSTVGSAPLPANQGKQVTAYFEGGEVWMNGYVVAGALQTTSDRRIKNVVGLSDRSADLALLNKIRITDYTYIDQVNHVAGQVVKKVIAQEVEEVLPQAVTRSHQALPNVYERATRVSFANGYLTVTTAKAHDLPATGGRMRLYTPANEELNPEVTVVDAHTVRFAGPEAHAAGLFVYGKYVDDFRSVDYDALSMLNVSATQELARKVAALEAENAALKTRAASTEAQTTATLESLAQRLRALEAGGTQARK